MSIVMVFGATGMLGASLVPALQIIGHTVITQGRSELANLRLDPSDRTAVIDALAHYLPDAVVNLVAATNVDQCETHPKMAWTVNAGVVANIAEGIAVINKKAGISSHLVQVSTDQVYDGFGPHSEGDVQPVNVYGLSKFAGELLATRVAATVLRTNFYGRSRCTSRTSLSDWIVSKLTHFEPITVFEDVRFSAVHIDTLCGVIAQCIEHCPVGIFNAGCRDSISKAEFAFALANVLDLPTNKITIGSVKSLALTARRPLDMSLNVSRLENILDFQFPIMLDQIHRTATEYQNG